MDPLEVWIPWREGKGDGWFETSPSDMCFSYINSMDLFESKKIRHSSSHLFCWRWWPPPQQQQHQHHNTSYNKKNNTADNQKKLKKERRSIRLRRRRRQGRRRKNKWGTSNNNLIFKKDLVLDLTFWFDSPCPGGLQALLLMGSFIRGNHRGSGCRGPRCCSLGDKKPGLMGKPDFGNHVLNLLFL